MPEIRIGSTFDDKGFKKAGKSTSVLEKNVKKLGLSLAAAFSTRAVVNFGKASVRASLQAQAEQDRLNQLLTVGVGATANQIAALNNQADALERLGVVSGGNITQTQSQLATFNLQTSTIEKLTPAILDYVTAEKGAAATTEQFKQMTNGLAQALNGNFASLTRVGFVIDENTKKQIKSGNESERAQAIVDVLNSTYKDFNKNLRETPAGQMQVLANAAEDAQTIIGGRLLDSMQLLAGEGNTVQPLADSMQDFATYTGDAVFGLAKLIDKLKGVPGVTGFFKGYLEFAKFAGVLGVVDLLAKSGAAAKPGMGGYPSSALGPGYVDPDTAALEKQRQIEVQREKDRRKQAALLLANENKRLKAEKARMALAKAQLALSKASKTIDLERISIEAALKGKISETDRLSLELQRAILNENDAAATKLSEQLNEAVKRQKDLALLLGLTPEAPNPYRNWTIPKLDFGGNLLGTPVPNFVPPAYAMPAPPLAMPETVPNPYAGGALPGFERRELPGGRGFIDVPTPRINVTVELDGKVVSDAIRDSTLNESLSGSFSEVNRTNRFAPTGVIPD